MELNQAPLNVSDTSGSESEVKPEKKKRDWSKVNRGARGGMPRRENKRLYYINNREDIMRKCSDYKAKKKQEKLLLKTETQN